jgi:hypothetical protein
MSRERLDASCGSVVPKPKSSQLPRAQQKRGEGDNHGQDKMELASLAICNSRIDNDHVLRGQSRGTRRYGERQSGCASPFATRCLLGDRCGVGGNLPSPRTVTLAGGATHYETTIGGLPVGTEYTFSASAADAQGTVLYRGSATADITKNNTTALFLTLLQVTSATPYTNAAPVIDSLVISSTLVAPGDTATLSVVAHDPNPGDTITYAWTARRKLLRTDGHRHGLDSTEHRRHLRYYNRSQG